MYSILHQRRNLGIAVLLLFSLLLFGSCSDDSSNESLVRTSGEEKYNSWNSVCHTSDNGYILCGYTSPELPEKNMIVSKTDALGMKQWSRVFSSSGSAVGQSVIQIENDYLACGFMSENNRKNIFLVRFDSEGGEIFRKEFENNNNVEVKQMKKLNDNYVILTGFTQGTAFLMKISALGEIVWEQFYDEGVNTRAHSVAECSDDGFIWTGSMKDENSLTWLYVLKTDSEGKKVWSQKFGTPSAYGSDYRVYSGTGIQSVNDGYIISVTVTVMAGSVGMGLFIDEQGEIKWFNNISLNFAVDCIQTDDGSFVFAGASGYDQYGYDAMLSYIDINDGEIFDTRVTGFDYSFSHSMTKVNSGRYALCGNASNDYEEGVFGLLALTNDEGFFE